MSQLQTRFPQTKTDNQSSNRVHTWRTIQTPGTHGTLIFRVVAVTWLYSYFHPTRMTVDTPWSLEEIRTTPLPHHACTPEGATLGFASEEIRSPARGEHNFYALQSLKQCVDLVQNG